MKPPDNVSKPANWNLTFTYTPIIPSLSRRKLKFFTFLLVKAKQGEFCKFFLFFLHTQKYFEASYQKILQKFSLAKLL